jgi:glucokinase
VILAGDIGGTKTVLSLLIKDKSGQLICQKEQVFYSQNFLGFNDILDDFLPKDCLIKSACFGVAGPIINQRCQTTNLPWLIEAEVLKMRFLGAQIKLINDLEAMALGMLHLSDDELLELNPNAETQAGNIAVIAPGTGLGQAFLFWDGHSHHSIATEGGHTDFAPVNNTQDLLLEYLRNLYPDHVSYERILSGIGFSHLYDFICAKKIASPSMLVPQLSDAIDRNAIISQLGVEGTDKACIETLNALLEKVSIKLSLNPRTPLLGAIKYFS